MHINYGGAVLITYEKLFVILEQKGKNKNWLRNNGINPKTVDYLIHNKEIKTGTINKLCNMLGCTPNDIITYTPDEND